MHQAFSVFKRHRGKIEKDREINNDKKGEKSCIEKKDKAFTFPYNGKPLASDTPTS